MRIIYIHAGKGMPSKLKKCKHHVPLFKNRLKLSFKERVKISHQQAVSSPFSLLKSSCRSSSEYDIIEELPRGQILGIALFSDTFWFNKISSPEHMNDPWCYGPFCYKIIDVFRLEKGIPINGNLGLWKPSIDIHNSIMDQLTVKNKINEWIKQYGDKIFISEHNENVIHALTIQQPFVEAILRGEKTIENRKRPIFRLHDKSVYKHPIAPKPTQCRFCDIPQCNNSGIPPLQAIDDNDNQIKKGNKWSCNFWLHADPQPVQNRRKRRRHSRKDIDINTDYSTDTSVDSDDTWYQPKKHNTRSRNSNSNNAGVNGERISGRKRKYIDFCNDIIHTHTHTPAKKRHKKSKHHRDKKKKKKLKYRNNGKTSRAFNKKWDLFCKECEYGEDGDLPQRMCRYGTIHDPINIDKNISAGENVFCDLCDGNEPISFDHYYVCNCGHLSTDLCYDHTENIRIESGKSIKKLNKLMSNKDKQRMTLLIQDEIQLHKEKEKRILKKKKQKNGKIKIKKKTKLNKNKSNKSNRGVGVNIKASKKKKKSKKKKYKKDINIDGSEDDIIANGNHNIIRNGNANGIGSFIQNINLPSSITNIKFDTNWSLNLNNSNIKSIENSINQLTQLKQQTNISNNNKNIKNINFKHIPPFALAPTTTTTTRTTRTTRTTSSINTKNISHIESIQNNVTSIQNIKTNSMNKLTSSITFDMSKMPSFLPNNIKQKSSLLSLPISNISTKQKVPSPFAPQNAITNNNNNNNNNTAAAAIATANTTNINNNNHYSFLNINNINAPTANNTNSNNNNNNNPLPLIPAMLSTSSTTKSINPFSASTAINHNNNNNNSATNTTESTSTTNNNTNNSPNDNNNNNNASVITHPQIIPSMPQIPIQQPSEAPQPIIQTTQPSSFTKPVHMWSQNPSFINNSSSSTTNISTSIAKNKHKPSPSHNIQSEAPQTIQTQSTRTTQPTHQIYGQYNMHPQQYQYVYQQPPYMMNINGYPIQTAPNGSMVYMNSGMQQLHPVVSYPHGYPLQYQQPAYHQQQSKPVVQQNHLQQPVPVAQS